MRTLDVLGRVVPAPPGRVLDVGGGPGTYASELSARGYEVVLIDSVPLHLEQARSLSAAGPGAFEVREGDARHLLRRVESEPQLLGASSHLLAVATRST